MTGSSNDSEQGLSDELPSTSPLGLELPVHLGKDPAGVVDTARDKKADEEASRQDVFSPSSAQSLQIPARETIGKDSRVKASNTVSPFWMIWKLLPSSLRMAAYRILLWTGRKLYGETLLFPHQRLPFNMFCKWGRRATRYEAEAMIYIRTQTTIPTPRVYDVIEESPHNTFILMSRLPGEPLEYKLEEMTDDEVEQVTLDLTEWFSQLRALPPPSEAVSGFNGSSSLQKRISEDDPIGPFVDKEAFDEFIYSRIPRRHRESIRALAVQSHAKAHRLCFTHGDLHPSNILILQNRVSGLIDYGSSGWFPEYWDYTGACYMNHNYPLWLDVWRKVFPTYDTELEVEREIWKVLDPV